MIYKNNPSFNTLIPAEKILMVCKSVFRLKPKDAEHDRHLSINIEHFLSETDLAQYRFHR
jgi:hypothetical protein